MPKSKRDRKVALTKTTKKVGLEFKQGLIDRVRKGVDDFSNLFVLSVDNMRNTHLQSVRESWKEEEGGRRAEFFLGKNRVMAVALGREEGEEYADRLHEVSRLLRGPNRGLMFTNADATTVREFFESRREPDFARRGGVATETVELREGALPDFGHAMEPQLRELGMPTALKKGVIHLLRDHTVCREGDKLTSEQARILKLFGRKQARFQFNLIAMWSRDEEGDGSFKMLAARNERSRDDEE